MTRKEREIADRLAAAIAEDLGLAEGEHPDRRATFVDLGLDSASVVAVAGAAEEHLGVEVPTEWLFDHPSIDALARHLASLKPAAEGERA
ncbi:hypothetical protein SLNWT_6993 [Streptomyces albus]|uniref:Carrier domain-containing protein n=1 Tax=Streptomyces albus (strain ATCC 21838 / DSM 41398 / FERM P-419 / JCM 4703 / NBRC 107858) TaxID=1081613 RepID=A0A0B5EZX5_STRA4|nr:hypothetical protein SLNWT_6993 [Streptomyces albus]AOU81672.1 hypothetical protein SLNHY_6981 [Streptomyces albus]AYN37361.1 hypothetical protein DUI70_6868 [Streptomyces albus]